MRQRIGFYGSTPSYWPVLELHDLGDLGRKLNALSKAGEWQAMGEKAVAAFSDLVKDQFDYGQQCQAQWQALAEKAMPKAL